VEGPATVHLLLLNLVALVVFGGAGGREGNSSDPKTGLEPRMRRARARTGTFSLMLIRVAFLVSTMCAPGDLGTKGANGCAGKNLAAAVLLVLTM
jgi:hypothetical protein